MSAISLMPKLIDALHRLVLFDAFHRLVLFDAFHRLVLLHSDILCQFFCRKFYNLY